MSGKVVKTYTNGEITITWKPDLCCHSTICYTELPGVFDPSSRPWIKADGAKTEKIIKTIKACPTQALTYEYNKPAGHEQVPEEKSKVVVHLIHKGPVKIKAPAVVTDENGEEHTFESSVAICRCGKSANFPFCDGTHRQSE